MRNYRPTRPYHRARSHEEAHSEEDLHDPGRSSTNPLIFRGNAVLIERQDDMLQLITRLRTAGSFAYDSEFIGELTYLPKLCLIQTATPHEIALIDPLAGEIDLTPFWELLADPSVEKITHAGQQDLEPVSRFLGRPAQNVFDTQVSAGFAGMAYPVALSKLVRELTGAKLGKGLTFSHWDQRPLSAQQLKYAANDVRYLPAVRKELGLRLGKRGHQRWAVEECQAQCELGLYRFDPEKSFLKVRGAGALAPQGLAILKELCIWRDEAARQHDLPPRAFLKDEILIELSRNPIKSVEKLDRVRGLPRPVEQAHGAHIVAATKRGLTAPLPAADESKSVDESPTLKHQADAVWAVAQCLCIGQGIEPDLYSSRQEIGKFYRPLAAGQTPEDLRLMTGWREEAVTRTLLEMIRNNARVEFCWTELGLQSRSMQ